MVSLLSEQLVRIEISNYSYAYSELEVFSQHCHNFLEKGNMGNSNLVNLLINTLLRHVYASEFFSILFFIFSKVKKIRRGKFDFSLFSYCTDNRNLLLWIWTLLLWSLFISSHGRKRPFFVNLKYLKIYVNLTIK